MKTCTVFTLAQMTMWSDDQDPTTWLFVAIAMGTGMRHSEILRIRWEDIDAESRRIYIGKAKAGQREQPIPPALASRLIREREQRDDQEGWLFPTTTANAKHPHRQSMAEQFARAVKRAKLDTTKVTPHILRHTAITGLVRAGVDLPTIQRISGHKTLAMVLRYTHLSDDHIDQAVAKLDSAFPDVLTPELHTDSDELRRGAA
jgi:integrase